VKVSDILARKGSVVITIKPSDTIAALSQLLREKRIGAVVVSRDGQSIDGFVSERDLAYSLGQHKGDLHAMPVSAIMTKNVITCAPDDNVVKVASTMHQRNVRHLPVVEGNRALGMISIRDVLNLRVDELQREAAMLRSTVNQPLEPQDRG
jgi:CBS domain-containing protein